MVNINQSTRIDGYSTVDISVECDNQIKEGHELLPINDFKSRFELMLDILKKEVMDNLKYEDE